MVNMNEKQTSSILFELLRSFISLADTLNLSKTVRELGSTRQTVRRHVKLLEERTGNSFFTVEDRQYYMTKAGQRALPEAKVLVARGQAWLNNQSSHIGGLSHLAYQSETDFSYHLQQHSLGDIWSGGTALLQKGFQCWVDAKGEIEAEAFAPIRPFITVFRLLDKDWICAEVGSQSSYATWYGWEAERSSIGRGIASMPGGNAFSPLLAKPFEDVYVHGGGRLDHIHTQIAAENQQDLTPISYQRLLLGARFPDGSFAMVTLIDRTHNIRIDGLSDAQINAMPQKYVMDVGPL